MNINSRQQKNINEAILSVPRNNNEELNEIASVLARLGVKGLSKVLGKSAQKGAQKGAQQGTKQAAKAAPKAAKRIPGTGTTPPSPVTGFKIRKDVLRRAKSDPEFKKKLGRAIKKDYDAATPKASVAAAKAGPKTAPKAGPKTAPKAEPKVEPKAGPKTTASAVDPNKPQMRTVGSKVDGVKTVGPGRKAEKVRAAARPSGVEPPVKPKMTAGQKRRDIQRQHGDIRRAKRQGKMGAISAAAKRYKLRRKTAVDPLGVIPSRREFKTGLKYLKRKTGSVTGGISTNPLVTGGLGYYLGRGSGDE